MTARLKCDLVGAIWVLATAIMINLFCVGGLFVYAMATGRMN